MKNDKKRRNKMTRAAFLKDKLAILAAIFLIFIIVISIIAPLLPLEATKTDVLHILEVPSKGHWFGTDEIGRDYFARVVYGGRVSITVGILAMLMSTVLGVSIGMLAGFLGGVVDFTLMRIVDVIQSIPWLILVTVVSIFFKKGLLSIIVVIGFFSWMEIARLVRAEVMSLKEREYIQYASFLGIDTVKIILRHLMPAVMPTIIVSATSGIADAIMTESALSFLGIGIQEPLSSWGKLLQAAQSNLQNSIYMALIPGLLIVFTIFSFNKLGNLLRIYLEPSRAS
ncbi:peptide/nickel transport system permease protein [Pseudobutyrivibrio sp. 49]|uniref:ABC transporter permease n=1 Tax=unclassified Pseudobutyrivibrio TaxID=2638619 RepID=UPI0008916497|nr:MULTISPECIES: ABC transporter permease [unclassified Pseudobutyrivibrio]SDI49589.1 peptide/nickel transport system permease protein [Pseudobutyrivibrio sp. 49]SFO23119.1 peptide/nickel transport system permease protein [Pseudobutyrivibrio sp. UC1225]